MNTTHTPRARLSQLLKIAYEARRTAVGPARILLPISGGRRVVIDSPARPRKTSCVRVEFLPAARSGKGAA